MKIRSDFVTNSSSSSYCVSLTVKDKAGNTMGLDFWPENEDGSGEVQVPLKAHDADILVQQIQNCASVAELRDRLLNALDLVCLFGEAEDYIDTDESIPNAHTMDMIADAIENEGLDDYEDVLEDVKAQNAAFQQAMDKHTQLEELESVTIREYFYGWGEFARDSVEEFIEKAHLESEEDWETKLSEDEIAAISDHMENDNICQLEAEIVTTLTLADGTVEKTYSFTPDF